MSRKDKLVARLKGGPKDFTWDELVRLLKALGYEEAKPGKIEYIRSLVTFKGTDVATLEEAFREAVDDYLATCRELGRKPEEPFKGTFNVRTGQDRRRRASLYAAKHDKRLNQVVNEALDFYLGRKEQEPAEQKS